MGYKNNRRKGAIANAKVNKLPRKQPNQSNVSRKDKDLSHIGGLAQLSRNQAKK